MGLQSGQNPVSSSCQKAAASEEGISAEIDSDAGDDFEPTIQ
jgi:hypothetical protein